MSNLIKSSHVVSVEELKRLEQIRFVSHAMKTGGVDADDAGAVDEETLQLKDRILADAEETAKIILQDASEQASRIQTEAEAEATAWWEGRRTEDAAFVDEAKRRGYEEGFASGAEQAEHQTLARLEHMMQEAQRVVSQAYEAKARIIAEAERFVVELSCDIAGKIVRGALERAPEMALDLMKQALSRRKEQGTITLCVAPDQFEFVEAAKDELALAVDSQAELQIVPDPTVKSGGCVIRSAYGSIDARVDTQLETIREELLQIAAHSSDEGATPDGA
ncbi:FliH/SctL family protein [Cohnella rhizosphaerae]|uniref:FliH/SctL family protein n=1 Tax=Cohnella rhizosphaerae TaxID=1457232 RepID=A0A9X4L2I5_9BACL|nr:FliH/SctL family protein [Cohnella rhizosphaerae]MDG0812424.1 FliH/SctL family protein [Cohnella rhizosphaerae]